MANRSAASKKNVESGMYPVLPSAPPCPDDDNDFSRNDDNESNEDDEEYRGEEEYRLTNRKYYKPGKHNHSGSERDSEGESPNSSSNDSNRLGNRENEYVGRNWFTRLFEELWQEHIFSTIVLCLIIMAVTLLIGKWYFASPTNNESTEFDFSVFRTSIKKLQQKFKSQDKKLWRMVLSSVNSVLNSSNPVEPAVILLLSSERAMQTVHKLATELGNSTSMSYHLKYPDNTTDEFVKFYCGSLGRMNGEKAGLQLDNVLNNGFHQKHVAVLFDIDLLPQDSSLILHSYCDNSNAPYKNVVIVLTATCDLDFVESDKDWGEIGEICMKNILSRKDGFNEDNIPGLLSRIANSVVVIVREEKSFD